MIKKLFNKLQEKITPPSNSPKYSIEYWREKIYTAVVLIYIFLGFFAYIFSMLACLEGNLIIVAIFDTIIYFSALFIIFYQRLPYKYKVYAIIFIPYILGVLVMVTIGKDGAGYTWLFAFPILAGILKGLRTAIHSILLNLFTFIFLGLLFIHLQLFPTSPLIDYTMIGWISVSVNFLFLNTVTAVSLGVLLNGLRTTLTQQYKLAQDLKAERQALKESNTKLTQEINQKYKLQKKLYQSHKLESIGTLASGVAHDFNNILTVIIGLTQLLLDQKKESHPDHGHLKNILKSGKRAANLTRQLLLFSRKQDMQFKLINLNHTITNLNKMLDRLISENINVELDLTENIYPIRADNGQIEQVITNLAVNARDAMQNGGTLTIGTENLTIDSKRAKMIPDIEPGKHVRLTVEDTGNGIKKDVLENIFDPFFTTKARGEGTGMGLSVVHGIIREHDGVINVYSEPGEGTIFKIYLPSLESQEKRRPKGEKNISIKNYQGKQETILIVEDEKQVLSYLESILNKYNFNFYSASSGEEALKIFEKHKENLDLIISDVIMTGIDGVTLADKLKTKKNELKIILSSGYSNKKVSQDYIKEKGFKFIQKPYDIEKLLKVIHESLN